MERAPGSSTAVGGKDTEFDELEVITHPFFGDVGGKTSGREVGPVLSRFAYVSPTESQHRVVLSSDHKSESVALRMTCEHLTVPSFVVLAVVEY